MHMYNDFVKNFLSSYVKNMRKAKGLLGQDRRPWSVRESKTNKQTTQSSSPQSQC